MYNFWYTTAVSIYTGRLRARFVLRFFFFYEFFSRQKSAKIRKEKKSQISKIHEKFILCDIENRALRRLVYMDTAVVYQKLYIFNK